METNVVLWQMCLSCLLKINAKFSDHREHCELCSRGLGKRPDRVASQSLGQKRDMLVICEVVFKLVLRIVDFDGQASAGPDVGDCHLVHGQSSGLV